jgi:hypothetical protein
VEESQKSKLHFFANYHLMNDSEMVGNNVNVMNQGLYMDSMYRNNMYDYGYHNEEDSADKNFNIDS